MKKLTCQNCKHTEDIKDMNIRENSKMYMIKTYYQLVEHPGLDIYLAVCFSCESLIVFAAKLLGGVEYFETIKIPSSGSKNLSCRFDDNHEPNTSQEFHGIYNYAHDTGAPDHVLQKLERIKSKSKNY